MKQKLVNKVEGENKINMFSVTTEINICLYNWK